MQDKNINLPDTEAKEQRFAINMLPTYLINRAGLDFVFEHLN